MIVATGTSEVALIDTRTNQPLSGVTLPGRTRAVAAAPDGSRGYVAAGRTVSMIDLAARTGAGSIPLQGSPLALAVSRDGTRVYAARKGAIEMIDATTAQRVGERKLSGTPIDLVVTPTRAVVVQAGGKVAVLDLETGRLVRRVKVAGAAGVSMDAGGRAWVSATTPRKGKRRPASRLVRIDPGGGTFSGSVSLGTDGGGGVGVSQDGTRAIVAPGAKLRGIHRKAALVDLTKRRVVARPPTGGGPGRASYSPDARAPVRLRQRPPHDLDPVRVQRPAAAHRASQRRRPARRPARARAPGRHRGRRHAQRHAGPRPPARPRWQRPASAACAATTRSRAGSATTPWWPPAATTCSTAARATTSATALPARTRSRWAPATTRPTAGSATTSSTAAQATTGSTAATPTTPWPAARATTSSASAGSATTCTSTAARATTCSTAAAATTA